ncbi:type II 3-dehydroquinate dehydratase [Janibacter terrae]|uniref:3-dehydroquinate dehydratase n=1 Tax=Janibacter terrae TaxID=103817 RepID=A0ABZ2FBL2_9MICO|nr:type II 3-dehydroquinate dehydratase [Janibacter terrae]MBA4085063.1 type II 3-dehydroquinate dehydratase [Kytococcus sp.]
MSARPVLVVLNGPNLNLLGEREPEIYGSQTLADVEALCRARCEELGWELDFRQTNHEGVLIDAIQEVRRSCTGLVLNAAGWTHTSVAIRDALAAVVAPVIEVHISDVHAREEFRRHSYISDVADEVIVGRGVQGYVDAVDAVVRHRS